MPAVFVHGVPDTAGVWQPLIDCLGRDDVVALSLPGFGTDLPDEFTATKEGYVDWLLEELREIPDPIDLVGHDWGSMLVVRAVSLRSSLVRCWVGGGAPIDPDYVWHQTAQAWQTPKLGEQVMAQTTPALLKPALMEQGQPEATAADAAAALDDTMKSCILSLYRSAVNVGREWTDDLGRITAPGLVLWGENDPYAKPEFGEKLAKRTGARFELIKDCGHWYQAQRPRETAAVLRAFWKQFAPGG